MQAYINDKRRALLLVNSLLFKLKVYFQTFSKDQGFVQNLFNIPLIVIILNCYFVRIVLGVEWFKYIIILIIFLFALLPVLATFPIGHSIIDSGLLLTMIIYTIFSVIITMQLMWWNFTLKILVRNNKNKVNQIMPEVETPPFRAGSGFIEL